MLPWNSRPQPDIGSCLIHPNHNCPLSPDALCSSWLWAFAQAVCSPVRASLITPLVSLFKPKSKGQLLQRLLWISSADCSFCPQTPISFGFHLICYTSQPLLSCHYWFSSPHLDPKFCECRDCVLFCLFALFCSVLVFYHAYILVLNTAQEVYEIRADGFWIVCSGIHERCSYYLVTFSSVDIFQKANQSRFSEIFREPTNI